MSDLRPRPRGAERRATEPRTIIARHGRLPKSHPFATIIKFVAAALAVVLVSGASLGTIALAQLSTNVETISLVGQEDAALAAPPALGKFEGGFDILVVGSDACENPAGCKDREAELNDVTMLLHVSADQTEAVAVSFPRDLVVPIPSCPDPEGGKLNSMSAQPINVTLSYGGLACTVLTVEALTGLDIPYAGLIKFNGVIAMSTAVGGVPVCVNGPLRDKYTGLDLPAAGTYDLEGPSALAFLRSRHGVGDGSDLGRISSQQVFLSSLIRTIKSDSTLSDFGKLFGIAQAATSNMTLSDSLSPLNTQVSMALTLKDIPLERITFVQYPSTTEQGGVYAGKVAPIKSQAAALFEAIASDWSFTLDSGTGRGSVADPNAPVTSTTQVDPSAAPGTAAPVDPSTTDPAASDPAAADPAATDPASPDVLDGVLGQTAAEYTCSKVNN